MAATPVFRASEVLRDSHAEITISVKVIQDWRFRLGLWLIRLGAN